MTTAGSMDLIPFVDLAAQFRTLGPEIIAIAGGVLARGQFILGPEVAEFEQAFAGFVGVKHAIGVSSGLDALRLALLALDVGPGHEVIIPANTYIATALAVSSIGARPVLVDCDTRTYNIDVAAIDSAVTPRTRAIIPVHLTGQAADMDPILTLAQRRGVAVIEDAAQAHGTHYKGRPCGSLGVMGCFSFYPGKNLGAAGDGGLIATSDPHLATRLRRLRNYGQEAKYEHIERGTNARLDTIQAAILNVKLRQLAQWNAARSAHADRYRLMLREVGDITCQELAPYSSHIYHLFVIETNRRNQLQAYLNRRGIQTNIHYPKPIHLQPAYADSGYKEGCFPRAETLAGRILSLPMFPELREDQIRRVAQAIQQFFEEQGAHPAL